MPTCGQCHRDLGPGAQFCPACGAPVTPAGRDPDDPFIGQTFRGTYFVQQKVGSGGMGQVYKAMHVTLDVPVALKILRRALLADPAIVQRFHREARAASRLRHPNVISVTDFGQTDDGTLFMVMEFVAGRSLARVIADEFPIAESRVVRIGAQILAALAEAHASQILHRDLKPENVMVESRRDERDAVKVLDFGIAKIQVPGDAEGMTLTQAGLVCGTPGYMSPEQWGGDPLDARSDLYSVGVILYEMLTGELPFTSQTPMEMLRKHLTERPLPPSARRPDRGYSAELEALVMRAIAPSREDRPASAEAMRAELLACALRGTAGEAPVTGARGTVVLPRTPPVGTAPGAAAPAVTARTLPRTPVATSRGPSSAVGTARGSTREEHAPTEATIARARPEPQGEPPAPGAPGPSGRRSRAPRIVAAVALLLLAAGGAYLATRRGPAPVAVPSPGGPPVTPPPAPPAAPAAAEAPAPPAREAGTAPSPPTPAVPARPDHGTARTSRGSARDAIPPTVPPREPLYVRDHLNSIPVPPPSSGDGVLSVQAEPFGDVILDGRNYGEAPKEFRVAAGPHEVKVVHPRVGDPGARVSQARVTVVAGRRVPWGASFEP